MHKGSHYRRDWISVGGDRMGGGNPVCGARVVAVDGHDWNTDLVALGTWIVPRPGRLTRRLPA